MMNEFHIDKELFFIKNSDGSVTVKLVTEYCTIEYILDANKWISLIASMSDKGATLEKLEAAQQVHGNWYVWQVGFDFNKDVVTGQVIGQASDE